MRILLVEDDPSLGATVQSWLQLDGYAVDWVLRGDSAATALQTHRYDCVLLDRGLPGTSGDELLRHLRNGKDLVPVFEIMVGNYTTRQLAREKKFDRLPQVMRNAANEGMQTFDHAIFKLWKDGDITAEEAMAASERPQELENQMKGIQIDGQTSKILGA